MDRDANAPDPDRDAQRALVAADLRDGIPALRRRTRATVIGGVVFTAVILVAAPFTEHLSTWLFLAMMWGALGAGLLRRHRRTTRELRLEEAALDALEDPSDLLRRIRDDPSK